jgi:glycosyltransferase involved in cell wall biosynthesis
MNHTDSQSSDAKLKVLQVMEATTGGTRRHLYYLLTHLNLKCFDVSLVYALERDPHFAEDLEEYTRLGIQLIEVPMCRHISPLRDLMACCKILRIIRKGSFDVIHAHSSKAGFLVRVAAVLSRSSAAVVYSPHSFAFQYIPTSLKGRFYLLLEKIAAHFRGNLLCVSQGEREVALSHGISSSSKIEVLPNAIHQDGMRSSQNPSIDTKKSLGIPPDVPVVGMIARFHPQKGLQHFVDAIPQILRKFPGTRFLLIGDGPLFPKIDGRIRSHGITSNVVLPGHCENVSDYYRIMDCYVLSSLWEGMPYTILEAMAHGLPVVASDTVGNNELVVDGETGYLVESANPDAIAIAIMKLLRDQQLRIAMGERGMDRLSARLSMKDWICQYQSIYERLAEKVGFEEEDTAPDLQIIAVIGDHHEKGSQGI